MSPSEYFSRMRAIEAALERVGPPFIDVLIEGSPEAAKQHRLAHPDQDQDDPCPPVTADNYAAYQAWSKRQDLRDAALPPTRLRIMVDRSAQEG
jgi:hypothetical protein